MEEKVARRHTTYLDPRPRAQHLLDLGIEQELSRDEAHSHDDPGTEAREETPESGFASESGETGDHGAFALAFVDLGEEGVSGLWVARRRGRDSWSISVGQEESGETNLGDDCSSST
jgi:hypothetical protein